MSKESNSFQIIRPFGPSIAKVTIPEETIKILNDYVDNIIKDNKKSKELDFGDQLAGNVQQEFKLEDNFMRSSGWAKFLANSCQKWISATEAKKISKFNIINSWIVRQFQNDYNPLHVHGGHISGVGYLKVPSDFGQYSQKTKTKNYNHNGVLSLVNGTKLFNSPATFNIRPKVGEFYFFPNYMMHVVYPFVNSNEERRSISFNASIDEEIYNIYAR